MGFGVWVRRYGLNLSLGVNLADARFGIGGTYLFVGVGFYRLWTGTVRVMRLVAALDCRSSGRWTGYMSSVLVVDREDDDGGVEGDESWL